MFVTISCVCCAHSCNIVTRNCLRTNCMIVKGKEKRSLIKERKSHSTTSIVSIPQANQQQSELSQSQPLYWDFHIIHRSKKGKSLNIEQFCKCILHWILLERERECVNNRYIVTKQCPLYKELQREILHLTLKVLNFWKFTSYCSLKPLWPGMGEVVPARTSPTLHPQSPPTVHQLLRLALEELTSPSWIPKIASFTGSNKSCKFPRYTSCMLECSILWTQVSPPVPPLYADIMPLYISISPSTSPLPTADIMVRALLWGCQ